MDLDELVPQLEHAKFARLVRYLFDQPALRDRSHVATPGVPLDVADSQFLIRLVGRLSYSETFFESWVFQLAHVPAGLCTSPHWREILLGHLERGLKALAGHPDPLGALLGSTVQHPYKELMGAPEGCDYYLFTNMACEPQAFITAFHDEANAMFKRLMPDPSWHPRFGLGCPKTLDQHGKAETEEFVRGLLRTPSGYQFVSRSGQIAIVPFTEHGTFLAHGDRLIPTTTLATATSILPLPELDQPSIRELESLVNDPRVEERDLQTLFEERPQLLKAINPHYSEFMPQICLTDANSNRLVPDFMVRLEGSATWDLVELKLPRHAIASRTAPVKPSARIAAGIAQLLRYRDFFTDQGNRDRVAARYGIAPFEPNLVLVAGQGQPPMLAEWRTGLDGYPPATLVSYGYILERARRCAEAAGLWDQTPE